MKKWIYWLLLIFIMGSCAPVENIAYFQQANKDINIVGSEKYEAKIKIKDILSITVVSSEPTASSRYNLIMPQIDGRANNLMSQPALQGYLVDNNGNIDFPSLGTLNVVGKTTYELKEHIGGLLQPYFTEEMPVITVKILNYSVNVLGEVMRPGQFDTENGRMTIFEGLALAGDMTIYGRRDNVKVLREDASGERIVYTLNLNNNRIFESPAFFLEQNDVVYVEPNQTRANSSKYGAAESFRITTISVLISLATLGATIFTLSR